MYTYDRNSARRRSQRLRKPEALLASKQPLDHKCLARRAWRRTIIQPAASWRGAARQSGAQVAGKLENSTAIVAADGEKSARIDLKVLPAFDKCPNEGKDEQLRSLLQHSFDELKLRYDGHVARFDCLTLCLIRCSHTHRKCFDFYNMHKVSPWTLLPLHSGRGNAKRFAAAAADTTTKKQKRARASRPGGAKEKEGRLAVVHYILGMPICTHKADYNSAEQHFRGNREIGDPGVCRRPLPASS